MSAVEAAPPSRLHVARAPREATLVRDGTVCRAVLDAFHGHGGGLSDERLERAYIFRLDTETFALLMHEAAGWAYFDSKHRWLFGSLYLGLKEDSTRLRHRAVTALVTAVLAGCGEPGARAIHVSDSAVAARRREFFAAQDSITLESAARRRWFLRSEELETAVQVEAPTLIAFYPSVEIFDDSLTLGTLVDSARAAAAEAGWQFGQRWTGRIRVRDPDWQAHYEVRTAAGSSGLIVVVPGRVPEVIYGLRSLARFRERLAARGRGPADGASRRGAPS